VRDVALPGGLRSSTRAVCRTQRAAPAQPLNRTDFAVSQSLDVATRLLAALNEAGVAFTPTDHRPVYTSLEAAEARGASLHSGAKALIVKSDAGDAMIVIPADMSLDGGAARRHLRSKRLRFASQEELFELTGLTPGAVPPFGSLFKLLTMLDERLAENDEINFNAGSHSRSIRMSYRDYIAFEKPEIARVAKQA